MIALSLILLSGCIEYSDTPEYAGPDESENNEFLSPTGLLMLTQKGSVNRSIGVFFDNVYLDEEVQAEFLELSEYPLDVFEKGIKDTMGTRYKTITGFSVISEEIYGEEAVVRHKITYDNNKTIESESYLVYRNSRWFFDLIKEIRH